MDGPAAAYRLACPDWTNVPKAWPTIQESPIDCSQDPGVCSVKVVGPVLYVCTILRFVTNVTDWRVLGYMINARKQRTVPKSCPAPAPAPAVGHDRVDGGTVDRDSTTPSPRSRLSTTSPPFQHSRPCPRSRQAACTCHLPPVRL